MAAMAAVAATVLIGAAVLVSSNGSGATPHQTELLNLWDKPYHTVTTTMLWNAASDDAGSFNSDQDDTEYDTYGHSSGDTELADTNWGKHSYSSDDNDGLEMPDTSVHSWDSANSVALKQELKHMFSKGINHVSKKIAARAEASNKGFFGKWAKVASSKMKSGHGKSFGLNAAQRKLYKEAEQSEQKEQAKKAPFIKAVKKVVSTEEKSAAHTAKDAGKAAHDSAVKAKLKAADKLAGKLAAHKASKKASKDVAPPKADPGKIGSKSAVKALKHSLDTAKDHKAKLAARKRMAALEQQIKNDFKSVTSFAHKVKTSLPPMKA